MATWGVNCAEQPELEWTDFPVCPHCGAEEETPWEIMDDMGDGDEMEYECEMCGGSVVATVHIQINYSTRS